MTQPQRMTAEPNEGDVAVRGLWVVHERQQRGVGQKNREETVGELGTRRVVTWGICGAQSQREGEEGREAQAVVVRERKNVVRHQRSVNHICVHFGSQSSNWFQSSNEVLPMFHLQIPVPVVVLPEKIPSYYLEAEKDQKLWKVKKGSQKPREKMEKRQNTEKV
ncbi:hypothetical protein B0H19DRAFT_1059581 [Mycena capillaripes]|nr:hypothetical protein B0H19DRAFT_1059581 [Mycena capillaripes]